MTDYDKVLSEKVAADSAFESYYAAVVEEHIVNKAANLADPTPESILKKRDSARRLQEVRAIHRADRPAHHVIDADFRGDDATAFMPDDQGGNTDRAIELLVELFKTRGDTSTDPATKLAEMRAGIS